MIRGLPGRLAHRLRPLAWARGYTGRDARKDLVAGLTVGVLLVPQGMAYAHLAGLSPVYGLYASLVPLVVYAFLGSAPRVAFGIVAVDMLVVGAAIARVGVTGPGEAASVAVLLAAMAGLIHFLMGTFELGWIVAYLSRPVVVGFMLAAPVLIGWSQVDGLLGAPDLPSAAVGLGSAVAVLLLQRFARWMPASLVVIAGGTALVAWLDPGGAIALVGEVPSALPAPALPPADLPMVRSLLATAVVLALVQVMTVVTLGRELADDDDPEVVSADRELLAVGAANILGSLFSSPPVSGSLSRSSVNRAVGGRTPMVNLVAAGVVLAGLTLGGPLLSRVPMPALAAVIVVSALKLVSLEELLRLLRIHRVEALLALATLVLTLVLGVQEGVLLGIGASIAVMVHEASRPRVVELGRLPYGFRALETHDRGSRIPGVLVLRVDGSLNFTNAEYVRVAILRALDEAGEKTHALVLDGRGVNSVDSTAIRALHSLARNLRELEVDLYLAHFKWDAREVLATAGLVREAVNEDISAPTSVIAEDLDTVG